MAALLFILVEATEHQRIMAYWHAPQLTHTALGEVGRRLLDHIKSKRRLPDLTADSSSLISRSKPSLEPASPFPHRVLELSEVVLVTGMIPCSGAEWAGFGRLDQAERVVGAS